MYEHVEAAPVARFVPLTTGIQIYTRQWPGERTPFVLLHGLASNCRLWEQVAQQLAAAGHAVVTVDQRGHGQSDKPEDGYDFATVTADLAALLDTLHLDRPIVAGQSWGGNVVLEFGARYAGRAQGLAFIDGGFLDLQLRPEGSWEATAERLRPPVLLGTPVTAIRARIRQANPEWSDDAVEAVLANFEVLADGTVRPWLSLRNHMAILRQLWEQRPPMLFPQVQEPVLICVAMDGNSERVAQKEQQVEAAQRALAHSVVQRFENTHHDIHAHRPQALAQLFLQTLTAGIWQ
ncbi:MAG: alpha/beta hydrolase [Caldilineaceae bacterium]